MGKITSFKDLVAWQKGHEIVLQVYKETNTFPRNSYSLVDQMRRSAVSVTSNVSEGFSRRTSKDKTQFYYMALGSLTELQNQLIISKDLKYLKLNRFEEIEEKTILVHK